MALPIVVIVGRPNVGKSTLFNRLTGKKLSITDDVPGVTRDGVFSTSNWNGKDFILIDTGGFEINIKNNEILKQINIKTKEYVEKANSIIFVVDCKSGILALDIELANFLKKTGKKIFLAVNKCDSVGNTPNEFFEFYSLFQENIFAISSIHGHNIGDLLDAIVENFKNEENFKDEYEEEENEDLIKIAIVGKPNVGKSSLINKLIGKEKMVVSNVAGTTRDAIDTKIIHKNKEYLFIDTAGIRKKAKIKENIEHYSVLKSFMAINRADIVLILLDATEKSSEQDLKIAGYVKKKDKCSIIVINKWDLINNSENYFSEYEKDLNFKFKFIAYSPHIFISAKTGQRIEKLYELIEIVNSMNKKRLTTGMLNELLTYSISKVQPPSKKGKKLKIFYITQTLIKPPTFVIFVNDCSLMHFSYKRYIENQIRKEFNFLGTPLKFILRENKNLNRGS